jgi:PKD repeat protein
MRLNFSQGILRHQSDSNGNPTFLQRNGQYVDLTVSPTPTVLLFAHKSTTYVVEETKTILAAWGPFSSTQRYLYWDLNLLSGELTRNSTAVSPVYSSAAPISPVVDQHWFDTDPNVNMFRVWTGSNWVERLRVFAGKITSGAVLRPYGVGSQAGLLGNFEGGHLVLDGFAKPLRSADGSFVNTATQLSIVNLGTLNTRLENVLIGIQALEEIPAYSCVQLRRGGQVALCRSSDRNSRVNGLVLEDLDEGSTAKIVSSGVVFSSSFNWPDESIGKPLYCGETGQLTRTPPTIGVMQIVGFVQDTHLVFVSIQPVLILDDPTAQIQPPAPPPITFPIANFAGIPTSGSAPLTVAFTSTSTGATTLEWDFLNDGYFDAIGASVSHTYSTPGTYTVRLRATNSFGSDDAIKIGYVTVSNAIQEPLRANLGLSFIAPVQVQGGQVFSFQLRVSNDGLADAVNVERTVVLKADNDSQITITAAPVGAVVTYGSNTTTIVLPVMNIYSGSDEIVTIFALPQSNVAQIQLDGATTSATLDAALSDNQASLTLTVRN